MSGHYNDRVRNLVAQLDELLARRNFAAYYKTKDMIWAARAAKKNWPAASCALCDHGCCQRTWHHTGDCCIHCGMDERSAIFGEPLTAEARKEASWICGGIDTIEIPGQAEYMQVTCRDREVFAIDLDAAKAVASWAGSYFFLYSKTLRTFGEPNISTHPPAWLDCDTIICAVPQNAVFILETAAGRAV